MKTLIEQFKKSLETTIPVMEYEMVNGDFLTVNINVCEKGFIFESDFESETWFSGEIEQIEDGVYMLPLDEYFEDIDHYLQQINDEITEGYLLPNNLI